MPVLWLEPATWFQGIQSRRTGGSSRKNASAVRIISWLQAIMRLVVITPLGIPVEPEVNSTLATVSGVIASCAAATADVTGVVARSEKRRVFA